MPYETPEEALGQAGGGIAAAGIETARLTC